MTYSSARLKTPTNDSKVYRRSSSAYRGKRIRITRIDKELNVRAEDFATVIRTENKGILKVRLDITPKQARYVERGYAMERGRRVSADRFIVTGDNYGSEIAERRSRQCTRPFYPHDGTSSAAAETSERGNAPRHEEAQKPPQRDIQRGYGIGQSLMRTGVITNVYPSPQCSGCGRHRQFRVFQRTV